MAISNNLVRELVHDILDKNNRGWLSPAKYNNFGYLAQMEIFESYFYDLDRAVQKEARRQTGGGNDYNRIPDYIAQKIETFLRWDELNCAEINEGEGFVLPSDFYRLISVHYQPTPAPGAVEAGMPQELSLREKPVPIERVDFRRFAFLSRSNLTTPDFDFPVYMLKVDYTASSSGDISKPTIYVYPQDINGVNGINLIHINYIRVPSTPKWTYTTVSGNPVYNASATDRQDYEIHPSDIYRLVHKILSYAGLSIRESDVVQYAEGREAQNKQQEVNS